MKLKLTTLVVGGVELTKRQILHHNIAVSTPKTITTANVIITNITATATKAKTSTINRTPTATTLATRVTTKIINLRVLRQKFWAIL